MSMNISHLGIPGSFSYLAAVEYFGMNNEFTGKKTFKEIFDSVFLEQCDAGIIPLENSLAGSIYENYDLLFRYGVNVIGEQYIHVEHTLIGITTGESAEERISHLKKVYSHPKALEQCSIFFEKNPHIEQIAYSDTAAAAKHIAELGDTSIGAIANDISSRLYKLQPIKKNIEDDKQNFTRFLVITRDTPYNDHSDKCSLMFTIPHVPGSLYRTLKFLADHELNLTKIESRPIAGKPFEYIFFIDFMFHSVRFREIDDILTKFRSSTQTLKVLGFYPSGSYNP